MDPNSNSSSETLRQEKQGFLDKALQRVKGIAPVSYTHLDVYKRQVFWHNQLILASFSLFSINRSCVQTIADVYLFVT